MNHFDRIVIELSVQYAGFIFKKYWNSKKNVLEVKKKMLGKQSLVLLS